MEKIRKLMESMALELSKDYIELIEKPWESSILNLNVLAVQWNSQYQSIPEQHRVDLWTRALEKLQLHLEATKPCLLTTRISALNSEARRALENNGFSLMECYLELEHDLKEIPSATGKNIIRPFLDKEIPQLKKLALESFQYSRFHMDPHIKTAQANATRAEWVENSCRGRAEEVLVAEVDERPVGFVICMESTSEIGAVGKLDLIAVHPEYRKRRLAYDLTVEFLNFCCQHQYALSKVGTQAHNIPSLRLYERTGFLMSTCYYSYHKHIV